MYCPKQKGPAVTILLFILKLPLRSKFFYRAFSDNMIFEKEKKGIKVLHREIKMDAADGVLS
jgi:hypothetical protein